MDDELDQLLSLGLRQSPTQGLQRRADFDLLGCVRKEMLDVLVVERGQVLLHEHELLLRVRCLHLHRHRHLLHSLHATEASVDAVEAIDSLHSHRWLHTLHGMEPVLQLSLDWLHFLLERVVNAYVLLPVHLIGAIGAHHTHLLLVILNERWLCHVDAMFPLNFVTVVN